MPQSLSGMWADKMHLRLRRANGRVPAHGGSVARASESASPLDGRCSSSSPRHDAVHQRPPMHPRQLHAGPSSPLVSLPSQTMVQQETLPEPCRFSPRSHASAILRQPDGLCHSSSPVSLALPPTRVLYVMRESRTRRHAPTHARTFSHMQVESCLGC